MSIQDEAKAQRDLETRARRQGREPFAQRMIEAVGDDTLRSIVRDNLRNVHDRAGMLPDAPPAPAKPPIGKGGWVDPPSVADWKPPGLNVMDRMMDAQDAIDRAEAVRRFNRLPLNGGK